MKNLFFFALIILFFACKENTIKSKAVETDPFLAGEHFMGHAKMGMSKADLLKFYPNLKADTIAIESELPCWTISDTDGKPLFWAIHADEKMDTITYLISDNPKMHTAEGIKVGSDYKELQKAFPDLTIGFAEGYRAYSKAKSMAFGIQGDVETRETKDGGLEVVKVKQGSVQSLEFDWFCMLGIGYFKNIRYLNCQSTKKDASQTDKKATAAIKTLAVECARKVVATSNFENLEITQK